MSKFFNNASKVAKLTQAITNFALSYSGDWDKYYRHMAELDMYTDACEVAPMTPALFAQLEAEWEDGENYPCENTLDILDKVEMEIFGKKVSDFM